MFFFNCFSISQAFCNGTELNNVWLSQGIEPRTVCLTHNSSDWAMTTNWQTNISILIFIQLRGNAMQHCHYQQNQRKFSFYKDSLYPWIFLYWAKLSFHNFFLWLQLLIRCVLSLSQAFFKTIQNKKEAVIGNQTQDCLLNAQVLCHLAMTTNWEL